jgi:caffeoyl-CoA O-methyltransferase
MKFVSKEIEDYSIQKSNTPSSLCDELQEYTQNNIDMSQMLIGKMEASFLGFLIRSHQVKNIVEFGTYTGYSALAMAESLPTDGKIVTFDIDEKNAETAKKFWLKSPHSKKITQVIGPALESIKNITFLIDLAFIDADKENYTNYLNACLEKLSPNGIIVIDNVLWSGSVLQNATSTSTQAIQDVNNFISNNSNLYGTLLPIRDGMFLVQRLN